MEDNNLLQEVEDTEKLKKKDYNELKYICAEIRRKIIDVVSKNGGHLASNLGTVELSVALHRVFDLRHDSVIWDVGHQSYTHKILSGRLEEFDTIRTEGGLSGFPKLCEDPSDTFGTGHSSTSISAAFGIAKAKELQGDKSFTVAVIGDGAMTGGLAFEGLNNAGRYKKNFIVVLNDNKMSISRNVGSLARYLTTFRTKPKYLRAKYRVERILIRIPVIGNGLYQIIRVIKRTLRNIVYRNTLFSHMGFKYYGPVEGNDLQRVENVLNAAKRVNGPVLVHLITTKGKGYEFAESNPKNFHGISAFDIETGEPKTSGKDFSSVFGETISTFAKKDKKVCAITAAMASGTGLALFSKKFKDRFFDVGIAEEHAVTFAGGLASKGMLPFFAVYSTFLQRSVDQVIHDLAIQKLHVILAIDRAGLIGEDGETHQGVFDVPLLNNIPNLTIYSPCYFEELQRDLYNAAYIDSSVVAVRYPRGAQPYMPGDFKPGKKSFDIYGNTNSKKLIVTYGRLFANACKAKESLFKSGEEVCILKLNRIKPIPKEAISFCMTFDKVFFFEEGMETGGIGEKLCFELVKKNYKGQFSVTAIDDCFVKHSSVKSALQRQKLDEKSMVKILKNDKK